MSFAQPFAFQPNDLRTRSKQDESWSRYESQSKKARKHHSPKRFSTNNDNKLKSYKTLHGMNSP